MEITLKKESVVLNSSVLNITANTRLESDVIVPDTKPDIAKIIQIDANVVLLDKKLMPERLHLEGRVDLNIIYVSDYNQIKSIVTNFRFNHSIDNKTLTPDTLVQMESDVKDIDFYILNSRKINIQIPVEMDIKAIKAINLDMATDLQDPNFEILRNDVSFDSIANTISYPLTVKNSVEIPANKPAIEEILKIDLTPNIHNIDLNHNLINISGNVDVKISYLSNIAENNIQLHESSLELCESIGVNIIPEENPKYEIDYFVKDLTYILKENDDGETKIVILQAVVELNLRVLNTQHLSILQDVYSTTNEVILKKENTQLEAVLDRIQTDFTVKETLSIFEGAPKIRQILSVMPKVNVTNTKWENDKLVVNGVINLQTLYITDNQEVIIYSFKNEMSFSEILSLNNAQHSDSLLDIDAKVSVVNFDVISETQYNIKCNLKLSAQVSGKFLIEYIKSIEITDKPLAKSDNYFVRVYFAKPGDSLWSIAKRYKVKMDTVREINDLSGEVEPGTKILLA